MFFFEVRTEFLNIIHASFCMKGLSKSVLYVGHVSTSRQHPEHTHQRNYSLRLIWLSPCSDLYLFLTSWSDCFIATVRLFTTVSHLFPRFSCAQAASMIDFTGELHSRNFQSFHICYATTSYPRIFSVRLNTPSIVTITVVM
jgi:hypothetical protein